MKTTTEERFWEKVDKSGSCWIWTASTNGRGYGKFRISGKYATVHRISYEMHKGPIPAEMVVMHSCDNRLCVNPDHLNVGTHADNVKDKVTKGREARGSTHGLSKLTEVQVLEIRAKYPSWTQEELAAQYGVTTMCVSYIVHRKTWTHI